MSSDPGEEEVLPAELTSRYAVSRVLGRGTAGEVRLAFRLPDLHPFAIKIIRKQPGYTAANSRYVERFSSFSTKCYLSQVESL